MSVHIEGRGWPQRFRHHGGRVVHAAAISTSHGVGFSFTLACKPDGEGWVDRKNPHKYHLPDETEVSCKACLASACYRNWLEMEQHCEQDPTLRMRLTVDMRVISASSFFGVLVSETELEALAPLALEHARLEIVRTLGVLSLDIGPDLASRRYVGLEVRVLTSELVACSAAAVQS